MGTQVADRADDLIFLMADDDMYTTGCELTDRFDQMKQHRFAGNGVQYLGLRRAHPFALPCREDDDFNWHLTPRGHSVVGMPGYPAPSCGSSAPSVCAGRFSERNSQVCSTVSGFKDTLSMPCSMSQ